MKKFICNLKARQLSIIVFILAIALIAGMLAFLLPTCRYGLLGWNIKKFEKDAEKHGWTEKRTEDANSVKAERNLFIEESDVASFLYHSGFSKLGKVVRIVSIIMAIGIFSISVSAIYTVVRYWRHRYDLYRAYHPKASKANNTKIFSK